MGIDAAIRWPGQTERQEIEVNLFNVIPTPLATWLGMAGLLLERLGYAALGATSNDSIEDRDGRWVAPGVLAAAVDRLIAALDSDDTAYDDVVNLFGGDEEDLVAELAALAEGARRAAGLGVPKITIVIG